MAKNYQKVFKTWRHAIREIAHQSKLHPNLNSKSLACLMDISEGNMSECITIMEYFERDEIQKCRSKRQAYKTSLEIKKRENPGNAS